MRYRCANGHPSDMGDLPCDVCGAAFQPAGDAPPEADAAPPPPPPPEPPPASGASVLRIAFGPGYEIRTSAEEVLLGRDGDLSEHAGFLGDHDTVSRRHATVGIDEEGPWIRDEYSSNGTKLNNQRLPPGRKQRLKHGTRLQLGDLNARVSLLGFAQTEEPDS